MEMTEVVEAPSVTKTPDIAPPAESSAIALPEEEKDNPFDNSDLANEPNAEQLKGAELILQQVVADCTSEMIQSLAACTPEQLAKIVSGTQVDVADHLANMTMLFSTFQENIGKIDPKTDADIIRARGYLTALMYRRLEAFMPRRDPNKTIDKPDVPPIVNVDSTLGKKLAAATMSKAYCKQKEQELKSNILSDIVTDPTEIEKFDTNKLIDDTVIAYWCETHNGIVLNPVTRQPELSLAAKKILGELADRGLYRQNTDAALIISLAVQGKGKELLTKGLSMDFNKITAKDSASLYADQAAELIQQRRIAMNQPLSDEEKMALATALKARLGGKLLSLDYSQQNNLSSGDYQSLALGLIMLLPMLQGVLDDKDSRAE